MAEEKKDELSNPANQPADPKQAPQQSQHQAATEKTIAEQQAKQGTPNPTPNPGGAPVAEAAAKQAVAAGPTSSAPGTGQREQTPIEKQDAKTVENKAEAAKAAGEEMLTLVVDGVTVEVPKGTLAIEACFRAGADVPYFCYHPRLTSVGACRMCLINIELEQFGQRRASIMTGCTVPAQTGMVIKTGTPDVKKAQNGILEFLLANHPLDCPICDRGGECPLQNMTIAYGPPTSRYIEEKRHFPKAQPLSDYVVLDRERCIQCMRCTRFTDEIAGDGQLDLINRGAQSEVGTFFGHDFSSNFSGNTIEICPVGALTSRTYRFAGRPWEVKSADSVCGGCGNGCNVAVQHRLGGLVRINARTNEDINEEWTCDHGKFGQYYVNDEKRLTQPLVRKKEELVPVSWDEALITVQRKIQEFKQAEGPDSIAGIASTVCTLEENYLFSKMFRTLIGTNNIDHQMRPYPFLPMQTSIKELENFKTIVSVGMELDKEQPIVYLRVYKAVRRKGASWLQAKTLDREVEDALKNGGENAVLLLPHNLRMADVEQARQLCETTGAKLNILLPDCNSWGAPRAGASPNYLPGMRIWDQAKAHVEKQWGVALPTAPGRATNEIFAGAQSGAIKMLYVMGADPVTQYIETDVATRALETTPFVVVQDLFLTETAKRADVVLPAASFIERDGTFVNIEGREQKIRQAIPPRGNSLPDWRILADLMARLGQPAPYFSARDIYREYSRAIAPE